MPYDMPMTLDEVLADEQARREAMRFLGLPETPPSASTVPTATTEPSPAPSDVARRYAEAQQADAQQRRFNTATEGFGNAAETILGGAGVHYARSRPQEPSAAEGVLRSARAEAEISKMGRPAKTGATGKPAKSTDPNSPESKRAQGLVKELLGDNIADDVLATMSEADADSILKYGTAKAQRGLQAKGQEITEGSAKATDARAKQRIAQDDVHFWAKMQQDAEQFGVSDATRRYIAEQALKAAEAARDEAAATKQKDKAEAVNVPDFEISDGATPTVEDAKKVKDTNEAAHRLRGTIGNLRTLRSKYGEAPKGTGADLQQQALRAVQLEAKNIVGLGALSGPDFGLMQDLSAQDVNSIIPWARQKFGGASLEETLQGMERWMSTVVTATAAARGYKPRQTPARKPAAAVLPTDASGVPTLDATGLPPPPPGKVRVRINGKVGLIPAANLAKAKAAGAEEVK